MVRKNTVDVVERIKEEWLKPQLEHWDAQSYDGDEWWQLSDEEAYVFSLSRNEMGLLVSLYWGYLAIIDVAQNELWNTELAHAAKEAFYWLTTECPSDTEFGRFAAHFGVSPEKAFCFYWKYQFYDYRSGIFSFKSIIEVLNRDESSHPDIKDDGTCTEAQKMCACAAVHMLRLMCDGDSKKMLELIEEWKHTKQAWNLRQRVFVDSLEWAVTYVGESVLLGEAF